MVQDALIHVAFADDHNLMRTAVVSLLESTGRIVVDIEAENGKVLLDKLEQAVVRPEICIIDISMPVMDGYTALREIRKRWPDMKTLILTGFNSEQYVIGLMLAGANGYLLKKCSENEIHDAIAAIHMDGYYYSECANSTLFHLVKTKAIKIQQFTDAEIEFLKYCPSELTQAEIAQRMKTTQASVDGYRNRLFSKLNVNSRMALALFAVQFGLVSIEVNRSGNSILSQPKTK